MPHIFSPHLANVPFLSDNRIATCQQVGNSRRLRDVLVFFFYVLAHGRSRKAQIGKKTDKSYSCFYVDSIFENGKITVFPILIISLESESHTAEGPRRPLPHLPGTVVAVCAHEWVPPPARGCAVSPFCHGNPRCPRHGGGAQSAGRATPTCHENPPCRRGAAAIASDGGHADEWPRLRAFGLACRG